MQLARTNLDNDDYVELQGETFFKIENAHEMPPFFMSLVGASDHWMFVSSSGALTAGRRDPDCSLFPYAPDDQIEVAKTVTGPRTLLRSATGEIWEPFSNHDDTRIRRNLFKSRFGTKLRFEEIHSSFALAFRYEWSFSERFGFVRKCELENLSSQMCPIELIDGLQNVLPYGVSSEFVTRYSNLANAYKKSELLSDSGLALFYLSSIPTDRAEPSEGLKATTVWQRGLQASSILISDQQLSNFRIGHPIQTETDIRGKAGAFLIHAKTSLAPSATEQWCIVAELEQDHCDIVALDRWLTDSESPLKSVADDVTKEQLGFEKLIASADGSQVGANQRRINRHLANTTFNVMRGGIPIDNYRIRVSDFKQHIASFHRPLQEKHRAWLQTLPALIDRNELLKGVQAQGDTNMIRIAREYLPFAFSRRHGDPTRPWNRFSIRLRSADGNANLDYQGNWRDIFQNWEALSLSFPQYTLGMIYRFVNATTADGYNPYRLTKSGFEWEVPEPDDPWSNIGYWGDHQIIYLLKLLERGAQSDPDALSRSLTEPYFVHANIPYRITSFECIRANPQSTIDFDEKLNGIIENRVAEIGTDGQLLWDREGQVIHVTLAEKLLSLSLAKLSNFIPDGGIWLNTQRPEWNDANNALVGNGLSMVTVCYLHRWFAFLERLFRELHVESIEVSKELAAFFTELRSILVRSFSEAKSPSGLQSLSPRHRSELAENLGRAGSQFRDGLYRDGLSGEKAAISKLDLVQLFELSNSHLAQTIRNNRREDGLYHAYNLLDWQDGELRIQHLYEMLEGQVAVLSAGLLDATDVLKLLRQLRASALYRPDQASYLLYPNRNLPRLLEKNCINPEAIAKNPLLSELLERGESSIVKRDEIGVAHFHGTFRNASDLADALDRLPVEYASLVRDYKDQTCDQFVELFHHREFTGRSGTFFAYEGLGSIYWHMVSKLALAIAENIGHAIAKHESDDVITELRKHYAEVVAGIGAEKTPQAYGAFPTDPYSHTPENAGVKQPGMTGQVKEDILSRFFELGVHIREGRIHFESWLFDRNECVQEASEFQFHGLDGQLSTVSVPVGGFAFTYCQIPIVLLPERTSGDESLRLYFTDGSTREFQNNSLDPETSQMIFSRNHQIERIEVQWVS